MSTAIVFGHTGLVGRHLVRELEKRDVGVFGTNNVDDLKKRTTVDVIFNAAGYTDIEKAERDPVDAFAVNAKLAEDVAIAAWGRARVVVYISTEFVFDGRADADQVYALDEFKTAHPHSVYARSKHAGEILTASAASDHQVIRLQQLYGDGGKNLLSKLVAGEFRGPFDNLRWIAPMWAGTAARLVCDIALGHTHRRGIWHVTSRENPSEKTTWWSFAKHITGNSGTVMPVSYSTVYRPSILLANARMAMVGIKRPTIEESYQEYLASR